MNGNKGHARAPRTTRPTSLTPEEQAAALALADERERAYRRKGPSRAEIDAWNATHATKVAAADFADPTKASVALYYHQHRQDEILRVRTAWSRDPARLDLASGGITADEIAIVRASVAERLAASAPAADARVEPASRVVAAPAPPPREPATIASLAAARSEGDLSTADLEKVHQLSRRMETAEREAAAKGRKDGFPLGERELSEFNAAVRAGRHPGARELTAADLRGDRRARLAVYDHLAAEAYRNERARAPGARGDRILGDWADDVDAKRPGGLKGLLGRGKAIGYEKSPETETAEGAEARLAARLVGDDGAKERDKEARVGAARAWLERASGVPGPPLPASAFAGTVEALEGYVYRGADGRPVDAHHVPFLERAAVRMANDPTYAPPSESDLDRYNRRSGASGEPLTLGAFAKLEPASRLAFARWFAAEKWEAAAAEYAKEHQVKAGAIFGGESRFPERTGARTDEVFEKVLERTRRENARPLAEAERAASRDEAYRAMVAAARAGQLDPTLEPIDVGLRAAHAVTADRGRGSGNALG